MRWAAHAAIGEDLEATAERVLDDVRRELEGETPDLVLAFASPGFDDATAARVSAAFPRAVVVGSAAGGVIGGGRELEQRAALAISAGVLPGCRVHVQAFGPELGRELEARHLRASLAPDEVDPALVLALLDPKLGDPTPLCRSLDEAFPSAVVSGGVAAGGVRGPCLLVDGRVSGAGGVLVAVSGALEASSAVAQGCRPVGEPMLLTRVEGQLAYELGQKRPVEVMRELHDSLPPEDRALFERALLLGIEMRDQVEYAAGDFLVRNVLGIEPKSGALAVGAELEPWKAVQFHLRDARAAREDLERCLGRALEGRRPAAGALLFQCVGRGEGLYGEASHDTRAVARASGGAPVGGFFCGGELGRIAGRTHLHQYTSSVVFVRPA